MPSKIIFFKFWLAVYKCQTVTNKPLRNNPKETSYSTFLNRLYQRADYGDAECIPIWRHLCTVTSDTLKDKAAVWHATCYASITNNVHLERARERYNKSVAAKDSSQLKRKRGGPSTTNTKSSGPEPSTTVRQTRSQSPAFNRKKCFFCQSQLLGHILHQCCSANIGQQISNIIQKSNIPEWRVNYDVLSDSDALSRDIMYHKVCKTRQWKKYGHTKPETQEQDNEETVAFIAAEMQFYAQLKDIISSGSYIPITKAMTDYTDTMKEHNIIDISITRQELRDKITQNIEIAEFTRPSDRSQPTLIHSKSAQEAALNDAANKNGIGEVYIIFQCAQLVCRAIEQANKWTFRGSLTASNVPSELDILLRWIVQEHTVPQTEARADMIHRNCNNLAQQVMQTYKSKKQVAYKPKSPKASFHNRIETL